MRQDILGGLKSALEKGESLKQAMISLHNAGYEKKDIEDSARALQQVQQPVHKTKPVMQNQQQIKVKTISTPKQPVQRVSSYGQNSRVRVQPIQKIKKSIGSVRAQTKTSPKPNSIQRVSSYQKESSKIKDRFVLFLLIFILVVLFGTLVGVFFFESEVVGFFNDLFSV